MKEALKDSVHQYNKDQPFITELLENTKLNKEGSSKDTRHFVISLKNSGITYTPGDSLYVFPENESNLVNELLSQVKLNNQQDSEHKRFTQEINITRASNKLFNLIEEKTNKKADAKQLVEKFNGYNLVNIIKSVKNEFGIELSTNEIADNSSKLQARAYSIASSLEAHPEEVHLCVARVDEEVNGQKILGVCSNYLSNRVPLKNKSVRIYLHVNNRFRLPEDKTKDIIMVGPGTGVAPFRAFIEKRNYDRDQGEKVGKDWLFFGDQKQKFDFLYENELSVYQKKYPLKVTTAFSRDQEQKIYVQQRMKENSKEIFSLLEQGAFFYVCGDARRMAKDVDQALHEIISENGKDAETYIKNLKDTQRYSRDVY